MRLAVPMISRTLIAGRLGEILEHRRRRLDAELAKIASVQSLAQGVIRRLHLNDEPTLESRAQALLEARQVARRTIARDDELLAVGVQRVEYVEQLFLRALFARDELHVVEQQRRCRAISRAPAVDGAFLKRADQLVDEELCGHARDRRSASCSMHEPIADRVEQMRLPDAARSVNEQRIVSRAGNSDDCVGGAHGELIARRSPRTRRG